MSVFHKYPEIVGVEKRPEILAVREVIATEKLHGTSFRVFFPDGMASLDDVRYGGRNEVFSEADAEKFYAGRPVRWFLDRPEMLQHAWDFFTERGYFNVVVYGEVIGAGIQKGVLYSPEKGVLFRAFDLRIGANLVTNDLFVEICDAIRWPRVPEVWRGEPSLEAFDALLEKPSLEGQRGGVSDPENLMEGVVIRSNPLLRTVDGEWLIVKHKSACFAEMARPGGGREPAGPSPLEVFARTWVLRGRLVNALGRLRDVNTPLVNGMADMRYLAPAVVADLNKECAPEWHALLEQGFGDQDIRAAVNRTTQGIYRRMLEEEATRSG